MFYNSTSLLLTLLLQSLSDVKLLESGLENAAKSDSQLINGLLAGAVLFLLVIFFYVVKILRKDKQEAVQSAYENSAKEQAINEGAHQNMSATKDAHIKYLTSENEKLKIEFTAITKDNTEVYKQLVIKVGSFVEGQAVVAANQEKNKSEILLEVNRLFSQLRSTN